MAFGRLRKARKKKEAAQNAQRQKESEYNEYRSQSDKLSQESAAASGTEGKTAAQLAEENRIRREEGEGPAREKSEAFFNRNVSGLTPQQRRQMQESANMNLNRQMQGFDRQLMASQGRRGLKGGAAYAQRADLARLGQESQAGIQNDLNQMDANLALKKLAAMAAMEQGQQSLRSNDYQSAIDQLNMENERKRNRLSEDYYSRLFSRV